MTNFLIGRALSPFAALLLVWLVTAPARRYVERRMPEGRAKRFLLRRVGA